MKNATLKRILIFVGLTFVITYVYEIFFLEKLLDVPGINDLSVLLVGSVMLIPAICVV